MPYLRTHAFELTLGFLLILVQNFTIMKIPLYFKKMLDEVMGRNQWEVFKTTILPVVIYTGITVVAMVFMRKLIIGVSRKIEFSLRSNIYDKLLSLNYLFFLKNETGDLVSRSTNDLDNVRTLLGPGIMYVPNAVSRFLIFIPVLFRLNFKLLLIIASIQGGLVVLIVLVMPRIRPLFQRIQEFLGTINNQVWQIISGITTIKLYTRENTEIARFERLNREYFSRQMALAKSTGFLWPFFIFVISITELVILWVGGNEVISQRMTMGELLQFTVMISHLTFPVLSLGWVMSLIQQGISSMKRINYILDQPAPARQLVNFSKGGELRIQVRNLRFCYPGESLEVLRGVSLDIKPNQIIGIAGPIGSGKSTLLNLLSGILQPEKGMLFMNGQDVVQYNPKSIMENVSLVPQKTFLFSRTIGENILMAKKKDRMKLQSVIRHAGLDSDLKGFPDGVRQIVGERGITLSGGQKQRVAIARAMMKKSLMLIFDDALSSVDSKTELKILEAIMANRIFSTFVFASHRISSLRYADIIYVLKDGCIIEKGNHEELIRMKKFYFQMARFQQLEEGE